MPNKPSLALRASALSLGRVLTFLLLALVAGPADAQVELPGLNPNDPIVVSAEAGNRWRQGPYEVWLLRGNCRIVQGGSVAQSNEAVLWIEVADTGVAAGLLFNPTQVSDPKMVGGGMPGTPLIGTMPPVQRTKIVAYLEGGTVVQLQNSSGPAKLTDQTWLGRFYTNRSAQVHAATVAGQPNVLPGVYQRAMQARTPATADVVSRSPVEPAQFATAQPEPAVGTPLPPGTRRIRILPRGDTPVQAQVRPPPPGTNQWIVIVDQGANLIVDGVQGLGTIDVATDRLVLWTSSQSEPDLTGRTPHDQRAPMEVYLEGNIVFRQGARTIFANRMYYDVTNQVGTVLDAELLTPVPKYEGLLRLRAAVIQQTDRNHFVAQDAYVTSSRLGTPGYRLQSGTIAYEDIPQPGIDPLTGQPAHEQLVTSQNNLLYLSDVPIFYWPTFSTDLREPSFFLRRIRYKNDTVFGTQILADFNVYQLLGIRKPPAGTDWDLSVDYMSDRGWGHGTAFQYHRNDFLGIPGPTAGLVDYWGISDSGVDNLGLGRGALKPEADYRYRLFWQHRQQLPQGFQVTAEVGQISDRNFLQEYFKREWDELKDQSTDVELKRYDGNTSWRLLASARLNDFFTETEWLPRGDHFWLGQDLFGALSWSEHTSLSYARFQQLAPPSNPADQPFSFLPWERNSAQGERLITRQELDWPVELGPMKVVPYALGEAAHWGEDLDGNSLDRLYYQAGVRASLPMWSVNPAVESALWNVHGLAHKVTFNFEFLHAEASKNFDTLPLYDPLDDNQIEAWRRRLVTYTFGAPSLVPPIVNGVPRRFDERFYALRTDMQGWVTAPSMEIAGDLTEVRLGVNQRWQTKRGMPENRHIVDWVTLDSNVTFFPNPDRDNFGTVVGLWDYDFAWHVGDRLTLVSDGIFDFFSDGQKIVSVGGFLTRPPRGSLYAGVRMLDGPISNQVLSLAYSYRMSPKWISTMGFNAVLGKTANFVYNDVNNSIGESLRITRIGESLLVSAGLNYDPVRNTTGFTFLVEPRMLPKTQLGQVGGAHIPPAGAFGLE